MEDTVYTIAGNPDDGYAAYNLRGDLCAAAETFAGCMDSIQQRIRSGWLSPGPIFRRIEEGAPPARTSFRYATS